MTITADDARKISDNLLAAVKLIDDYLDANWEKLSRAEYEAIAESQRTILRMSSFIITETVDLSIKQMQDDAGTLKQVTADAQGDLATLNRIGTAIRLVAGLADLATAIVAKDLDAIFKTVKSINESNPNKGT